MPQRKMWNHGVLTCGKLIGAVAALTLSTSTVADAQSEIVWWETGPAANTYYQSQMTGNIIPVRHTDPPYDPGRSKLLPAPPHNQQQQVMDEINFEAAQVTQQLGILSEIRAHQNSMASRAITEVGAVVTQTGTVAKEQRQTMYDSLSGKAIAQARLIAIGRVLTRIQPKLTRDGLRYYTRMMETEQQDIEIHSDILNRLDKTQIDAVLIDFASLGLARVGGWAAQGWNRLRTGTQSAAAQRVATQATNTSGAQAALVQAEQRLAQANAHRVAIIEAERKIATGATEKVALRKATEATIETAQTQAAAAARAETTAVAREAEAEIAANVAKAAEARLSSANSAVMEARRAANATSETLAAAERSWTGASAATKTAEEGHRAAQHALKAAEQQAAAARYATGFGDDAGVAAARETERQAYLRFDNARRATRELNFARQRAAEAARRATGADRQAAQAASNLAEAEYRAALQAQQAASQETRAAAAAVQTAQREASVKGVQTADAALARARTQEQQAATAVANARAGEEKAASALAHAADASRNTTQTLNAAQDARAAANLEHARAVTQSGPVVTRATEARAVAESAKAVAQRAETEASAMMGRLAREALDQQQAIRELARHVREAAKLARDTLWETSGAFAKANQELAEATQRLGTAQAQRVATDALRYADAAVQQAMRRQALALEALRESRRMLTVLEGQLAKAAELERVATAMEGLRPRLEITRTGAPTPVAGFVLDLLNAVVSNITTTDPFLNAFGPMLVGPYKASVTGSSTQSSATSGNAAAPAASQAGGSSAAAAGITEEELRKRFAALSPEQRAEIEGYLKDAPAAVQESYRRITGEGAVGPGQQPARTASAGAPPLPADSANQAGADIPPLRPAPQDSTQRTETAANAEPDERQPVPIKSTPPMPDSRPPAKTGTVPNAPTKLTEERSSAETGDGGAVVPPGAARKDTQSAARANQPKTQLAGGLMFEFRRAIPEIEFHIGEGEEVQRPRTAWVQPPQTRPEEPSSAEITLTEEQRALQLAAIGELRTGDAVASGTQVSPSLGRPRTDPSALVRRDVEERVYEVVAADRRARRPEKPATPSSARSEPPIATQPSEVRVSTESADDPPGGVMVVPEPETQPIADKPAAVAEIVPDPKPTRVQTAPPFAMATATSDRAPSVPTVVMPAPSASVPVAPAVPAPQGLAGTYRLADSSSGVAEVTITSSGGRFTLTGIGPPILLEQDGNSYFGEGAVLFSKGDHQIRLEESGGTLRLSAEHPAGGSFSTTLTR